MNVRIATYNLFEGAGGSYNRLVEFVRTQNLDMVCLQEVNGWQDNDFARLKDFTDKVLFAGFAFGNTNTEYKLATISKPAIIDRHLHAEAFWHGAIEVRVRFANKEISVVNVHLDPWKEDSRDAEIARLLNAVGKGKSVIITGDFNSLSHQDNYPPELLGQLRDKGISKYGQEHLEFRVIDRLLQAGYVDVAAAKGVLFPTVPSAFNTDRDHEVPVRVDYMFVSPDLVPYILQAERVKTDLTDAISDHYPLILTLSLPDGGGSSVPVPQQGGALPSNSPAPAAPGPFGPGVPSPSYPSGAAAQPWVPPAFAPVEPWTPPADTNQPVQPWTPPSEPAPAAGGPDGEMPVAHEAGTTGFEMPGGQPPQAPNPADAPYPSAPVKPWVPEGFEDYGKPKPKPEEDEPKDTPPPPPPEPPKPADGEVVMWSHGKEK